jgi:hypothetical protein
LTFGVFDEQIFHHRRDDVSRTQGIDANSVLAPFAGKILGQLLDSGLGGIVGRTNETLSPLQSVYNHLEIFR